MCILLCTIVALCVYFFICFTYYIKNKFTKYKNLKVFKMLLLLFEFNT